MERLLRAAQHSHYYRRHGFELGWPRIGRDLERAIESLPSVPLGEFLGDPAAFHTGMGPKRPRKLAMPLLAAAGRVAILAAGYEESADVRSFHYEIPEDLAAFRPDTIAAPVSRLRRMAEDVLSGRIELPELRSAVIGISGLTQGHVTTEDRDLFWKAFRVPVFEQLRGFSRELLAWECDAHDGLHIDIASAAFELTPNGELLLTCLDSPEYTILKLGTELTARIDDGVCDCGDATPRLVGLRRHCAKPGGSLIGSIH